MPSLWQGGRRYIFPLLLSLPGCLVESFGSFDRSSTFFVLAKCCTAVLLETLNYTCSFCLFRFAIVCRTFFSSLHCELRVLPGCLFIVLYRYYFCNNVCCAFFRGGRFVPSRGEKEFSRARGNNELYIPRPALRSRSLSDCHQDPTFSSLHILRIISLVATYLVERLPSNRRGRWSTY